MTRYSFYITPHTPGPAQHTWPVGLGIMYMRVPRSQHSGHAYLSRPLASQRVRAHSLGALQTRELASTPLSSTDVSGSEPPQHTHATPGMRHVMGPLTSMHAQHERALLTIDSCSSCTFATRAHPHSALQGRSPRQHRRTRTSVGQAGDSSVALALQAAEPVTAFRCACVSP